MGAVLQQAPVSGVWVAYSGGLDSHVLLHLAAQFNQHHPDLPVRAIHIHHQIQAISAQWVKHCERQCEVLGIPLVVHTLTLDLDSGESIEALARTGRYQVFSQLLEANEILFTAHHQDDQAETLLLNLLRGAGMAGLAAMPVQRALGKGYLVRPLLGFARAELEHYAHTHQLDYIDDPSNTDTRFNRNLLRHQVIPLLERRWPATKALLARAAQHQQEALALTQTLLQEQLKQVQGSKPHTLSVQKLGKHTAPLQKALIRAWLEQLAFLMPSTARLDSILTTVLPAKVDANPLVQWSGCEVRRYRDDLYALKPLGQPRHSQVVWTGQNTLIFNEYLIQPDSVQAYLTAAQETQTLFKVCIRQGGERFKQGKQWLDLKTYWQTKGIPPWERERRPLIYFKGELISIPEVEFDQTLV